MPCRAERGCFDSVQYPVRTNWRAALHVAFAAVQNLSSIRMKSAYVHLSTSTGTRPAQYY